MVDIKLFVCCHQKSNIPCHALLVPIQVGAALAKEHYAGFISDDTGDNISTYNRSYCELTAQYWAWKNIDADYYGFFHYRRYLYPNKRAKYPYRLIKSLDSVALQRLQYDSFATQIQQYDMIMPKGENMFTSVREHYSNARYHHKEDLRIVEEIVREKFPDYIASMEEYLSGSTCYFGNIYIMKREVFRSYCAWLFEILYEFDQKADLTGYSTQEMRVDGYLAERLLGIYYTYQKHVGILKLQEYPRVHLEPNRRLYYQGRITRVILPPGTKRRYIVKKLLTEWHHE